MVTFSCRVPLATDHYTALRVLVIAWSSENREVALGTIWTRRHPGIYASDPHSLARGMQVTALCWCSCSRVLVDPKLFDGRESRPENQPSDYGTIPGTAIPHNTRELP